MKQPIPIPSTWKPKPDREMDFYEGCRALVIDVVHYQYADKSMVVYVYLGDSVKWVEYFDEFERIFEIIEDNANA